MNRIDKQFKKLKTQNKKAFIPFIVAGVPDFKATRETILEFDRSGATLVEIGVPFSDPLADGSIIQTAANIALSNGVTLKKILNFIKHLRNETDIAIVLFSYCNPIFSYGIDNFVSDCVKSGIDGLIIPDLPPEEACKLTSCAKKGKLKTIFLITPTTEYNRTKEITQLSSGFIYYVSVTGITGPRNSLPIDIKKHIQDLRKQTKKPICVGFGISNPKQVRTLSTFSDGVIIGSAIVRMMLEKKNRKQMITDISTFVTKIQGAL